MRTHAALALSQFAIGHSIKPRLGPKMDDRLEKEAALRSLSVYSEELLDSCKDSVDLLDALEELAIITEDEKDDANDSEDYSSVVDKLATKIEDDPSFFESFCLHIKKVEELERLADRLLGKSYQSA